MAATRPSPNLTQNSDQDDGELEHGRGDVEEEEIEHHVDALGAALDDLGDRAGAPLEVEAQRQIVEVAEGGLGEPPRRVLADPLENAVAQIVEQHAAEARAGISDDQRDGDRHRRLHARRHPVHRRAEGERHDQGGDRDRDQDQQQRQDDARLQPRLARRPEIGKEAPQDAEAPSAFSARLSAVAASVASFAIFVAR